MESRQQQMITVQIRPPQKKLEVNITAIFSDPEVKALSAKFSDVGIEAGIKGAIQEFFEDLTGFPT